MEEFRPKAVSAGKILEDRYNIPLVIVYHPKYLEHVQDRYHPESPQRLEAIVQKLQDSGLMAGYLTPEQASKEDLYLVHTEEYVDFVQHSGEGIIDYDTTLHTGTYDIAVLSVGGGLLAAHKTMEERKPYFALIRPPGHHAGPGNGGGFCYFNNIAIAAMNLLKSIDRVAILDYDGHHGNGTSDIFQRSKSVVYMSTHQWGIYPGTGRAEYVGEGDGEGHIVNVPFPGGCGDSSYDAAFEELFHPILREFKPKAILISFGGDSHYKDPLTSLSLSSPGYLKLMKKSLNVAREMCGGRFAVFLEGGYHLQALAEVVAGIIASFENREIEMEFTEILDSSVRGRDAVEKAKEEHSRYWKL
ncbi:MAG: histone deacetylase family protein [Thermoplasmata archaeon]